jgi:hypothetical protein
MREFKVRRVDKNRINIVDYYFYQKTYNLINHL